MVIKEAIKRVKKVLGTANDHGLISFDDNDAIKLGIEALKVGPVLYRALRELVEQELADGISERNLEKAGRVLDKAQGIFDKPSPSEVKGDI